MSRTNGFRMRHGVGSLVVLAGLAIAVRRGAANAPAGRYTITNGGTAMGTVLDTKTGLTWQQMVPAGPYTQPNAITYCTSNAGGLPSPPWRLPSIQELQTIVDYSQTNSPAIDAIAFPNTPADYFWTSSPYVPSPGDAWGVFFNDGYTHYNTVSTSDRVRCVR